MFLLVLDCVTCDISVLIFNKNSIVFTYRVKGIIMDVIPLITHLLTWFCQFLFWINSPLGPNPFNYTPPILNQSMCTIMAINSSHCVKWLFFLVIVYNAWPNQSLCELAENVSHCMQWLVVHIDCNIYIYIAYWIFFKVRLRVFYWFCN